LLRSTRQQYHARIAHVLEVQFPETVATQPELLAHHYTEAGLTAQAMPYWQQAGQRALERSANLEAVSHCTTGIELLKTLPETPARTQQSLTLYIALGAALLMTKGQAAPEVEQAYTQARALCQQVGETPELVPVLYGLWRFYVLRPQLHTACELAETLLHLAQCTDDPALAVMAHYEQNPQSARRNNVSGEQISRWFLLLSENLSASNYPGAANPVVAYGRSNDLIASQCLVMRCPDGGPLFASSRWLPHTG